jgi:hypothetical protein
MGTIANAQLKLSLTSDKTTFILGEPVIVYVTVKNTGRSEVKIPSKVDPKLTDYVYYVTGTDGKEKVYSPVVVGESVHSVTLKKNETLNGTAELFFGGGEYYFKNPGKYKIEVKYGETKSAPFTINVKKSNEENEAAKMIFGSKEVGFYYEIGGSDELKEANKIVDQLIKSHSKSPVADYFAVKRAQNLSVHARNFVTKKPRAPKYDEALKILNGIKDKKMPLFYKDRVTKAIVKIYNKTNKTNDAVKELEQFKSMLNEKAKYKKFFIKDVEKQIEALKK